VLAELTVAAKQVERVTKRIGQERLKERDAAIKNYLEKTLAQRDDPPPATPAPQVAAVEMDGGRIQILPAQQKPDKATTTPEQPQITPTVSATTPEEVMTATVAPAVRPAEPTVRATTPEEAITATVAPVVRPAEPTVRAAPEEPMTATVTPAISPAEANTTSAEPDSAAPRPGRSKHWRADKVGCLMGMTSVVSASDPCPDIPAVFVDPLCSLKLAQEIGHSAVPQGTPFTKAQPQPEEADTEERRQRPGRPEIVSRRVVASRQDVDAFGPLLAAAAWAMGLFGAARRAFVCDGLSENWSVQKRYFPRWTPILDFVHALTYVYAAAMAGRTFAEGWPVYERWIKWVWGGKVSQVIKELTARQQELGPASKEDKEGSPRRVVQEALTYLKNQQDKMRYDEYRKQGLPLMSSYVESTVKQINYRMKGTEKFWSEDGAEALLQLRADYLSDDEPMEAFWERRQAAATGQRPYRRSA
jgi:hypothetical protein